MAKKVFVTGATGFIGTAIVSKLIHSSYQAFDLTRSKAGKQSLLAAGVDGLQGNSLHQRAEMADACSRA